MHRSVVRRLVVSGLISSHSKLSLHQASLRAHLIIVQYIFDGADHFGPGKDNRLPTGSGVELEGDEFISLNHPAKELDSRAKASGVFCGFGGAAAG